MLSKNTSMFTPWIWMSLVVRAVAVHGKLVPAKVAVHEAAKPAAVKMHPVNDAAVISITAGLTTSAVSCALLHIDAAASPLLINPKSDESRVWCVLTGLQLSADAIDGIANAHTIIAVAKRNEDFKGLLHDTAPCECPATLHPRLVE